jgi:hypothetical protein
MININSRDVFSHPAFPEFETSVRVKPGETNFVRVSLDTLFGYLDCQVFPWGKIFVDDTFVDVSPLKRPLPLSPGRHKVQVENPGFEPYTTEIVVSRKDTVRLDVHFGKAEK